METCRDVLGCGQPAVGVLVGRTQHTGRLIGRRARCQKHLDAAARRMRQLGFSVGQVSIEAAQRLRREAGEPEGE